MSFRPGYYRHSPETRRRLSEIAKQRWANVGQNYRAWHAERCRKAITPERRAEMSDRLRLRWRDDPDFREACRQANGGRPPSLPEMTADQRKWYDKLRRYGFARHEALREIFGDHVPPPRGRRP